MPKQKSQIMTTEQMVEKCQQAQPGYKSQEHATDEAMRYVLSGLDPVTVHCWKSQRITVKKLLDLADRAIYDLQDKVEALKDAQGGKVIADILAERKCQDKKWGGPEHDDEHTADEWVQFIKDHAEAAPHYMRTNAAYLARKAFIRVAALAVAAVESMDRKGGA